MEARKAFLTISMKVEVTDSQRKRGKMSEQAAASWDRVSANLPSKLGMTMLRGRFFNAAENDNTAPVAIVNEAFAKRFFKTKEDPLNQHFGLDMPENAATFRIIRIVRDAKFAAWGLREPARPIFYMFRSRRTWITASR